MLWFSVQSSEFFLEYRLPDNESFFTLLQWRQYQELSELAGAFFTTVEARLISGRR